MGRLPNLILGSFATAMIAAGLAAQTGTIQLPRLGDGAAGATENAVPAPAEASPSPAESPSPTPSQVVAPPSPGVSSTTVSGGGPGKTKGRGH